MMVASSSKAEETAACSSRYVEKVAYRDGLGRSGLFTGEMEGDDAVHGSLEYNEDKNIVKYTGKWKEDHWKDDTAYIEYKNGDTYTGSVLHSRKEGSGQFQWKDGRTYSGAYVQDLRHGEGRYEWPDGQFYVGTFCKNQRDGFGSYQTGDGLIQYTGRWKNGLYEGEGTYQYPNETNDTMIYTGEFHNGKPHGKGKETCDGLIIREGKWIDGVHVDTSNETLNLVLDQPWFDAKTHVATTYRGLMNEDRQPHGNGTAMYKTGDIALYEGCWKDGIFQGQGRLVYRSGEEYIGVFQDGDRHGTGTFKWTDGRQYSGKFVHNQRTGQGVFTWDTGDRYEGEFIDGKRSGYGTFVFDNGAYYSGHWKHGLYHGRGKTVDSSGACYIGDFRKGQRHGEGEELDCLGRVSLSGQWSQGIHESSPDYVFVEIPLEDPTLPEAEINKSTSSESPGTQTESLKQSSTSARSPSQPPPAVPPPAVPGQQLLRTWQAESASRSELIDHDDCTAVVDRKVTDGLGCVGLYTGIVWKQNHQPHGVGRLVYSDGKRIHEGFWQYGNKEGHGRCLFLPQYDFHEGEYHRNLRHGHGRYSVSVINVGITELTCILLVERWPRIHWRVSGRLP